MIDIDSIPEAAFKSHTRDAIAHELARPGAGWVWHLDTGSAGSDDVLVGERSDVERDVLAHHEITTWPERWTLTRVG